MSPAALALCFCLSLGAGGAPPGDRWLGEDKWKHFFASFVVTSISASAARTAGLDAGRSAWVGAGVGTAAGVWKEWRDRGREGASVSARDLAWDLAGVGAATAVANQVR